LILVVATTKIPNHMVRAKKEGTTSDFLRMKSIPNFSLKNMTYYPVSVPNAFKLACSVISSVDSQHCKHVG